MAGKVSAAQRVGARAPSWWPRLCESASGRPAGQSLPQRQRGGRVARQCGLRVGRLDGARRVRQSRGGAARRDGARARQSRGGAGRRRPVPPGGRNARGVGVLWGLVCCGVDAGGDGGPGG